MPSYSNKFALFIDGAQVDANFSHAGRRSAPQIMQAPRWDFHFLVYAVLNL